MRLQPLNGIVLSVPKTCDGKFDGGVGLFLDGLAAEATDSLHFHIFFFSGARSAKFGSRFCVFAANASIMWGGENMPACQVAM